MKRYFKVLIGFFFACLGYLIKGDWGILFTMVGVYIFINNIKKEENEEK